MEKKRTRTITIVVFVVVALGVVLGMRSMGGSPNARPVETATLEMATVKPALNVTGNISAVDERSIDPVISGEVTEILVTVGDTVTAGQELIKLDTADAQQNVSIADANLKSAKARLQELKDQGVSSAQIASQDAVVAKANADYQAALGNRDSATISSPIDGTVIAVNAIVGGQVGASGNAAASASGGQSSNLIKVADLGKLQIKAAIDQADISKVAVNQSVNIKLDALPGKKFAGQITAIDPMAETNSNVVTYNAYISLSEIDAGMRLGMSADLEIDLGQKENVLVVPNIAVRTRGEQKLVTKMIDGEPTEIEVETGVSDSERTEIVSGLSEGDKITLQSFTPSGSQAGNSGRSRGFMGMGGGGRRGGSGGGPVLH